MTEQPDTTETPLSADEGRVRRFARRRQANQTGGRPRSHRVKVTDAEAAALAQVAAEQGVTVPRLLVESALCAGGPTPAIRQEAMAELFAMRRLLAGVSNNVNQIARHANTTSEFPADAASALHGVRRVVQRIDEAIDELSLVRPRVKSRTDVVDLDDGNGQGFEEWEAVGTP